MNSSLQSMFWAYAALWVLAFFYVGLILREQQKIKVKVDQIAKDLDQRTSN